MRFCIVSPQYLPTIGGVERYTAGLAGALMRQGHTVTVVTSALPGLPMQEAAGAATPAVLRVSGLRLMAGRLPVARPAQANRVLRAALTEADFCLIQTRFYPLSLLAARMARKLNCPAMVVEHGSAPLLEGGLVGLLGSIYERLACRYAHRQCPDFCGVSPACCQWLAHFGVHTDTLLSNAVDPDDLDAAAESGRAALAQKLASMGLDESELHRRDIAVYSGRLIPEKGILPLTEAFAAVQQEHPRALLLLAGGGPLLAEVQALAHPAILALGPLEYNVNAALLALADIFVLPTRSEGFACTVLEAAALRTAILTTPTGGSPLLLIDEAHGTLFADMSPQAIGSALEAALADPDWRATAAALARQRLCSHFTWDKVAAQLISIAQGAQEKHL